MLTHARVWRNGIVNLKKKIVMLLEVIKTTWQRKSTDRKAQISPVRRAPFWFVLCHPRIFSGSVHQLEQPDAQSLVKRFRLSGKPKWPPLNFRYHDVMRTGPISLTCNSWMCQELGNRLRSFASFCHALSFPFQCKKACGSHDHLLVLE